MQLAALLFVCMQAGLALAQSTTLTTTTSTQKSTYSQTSQVTAQGGIQDYDGAPNNSDDGSSGTTSGSFSISQGAITAIIVVCVVVATLGIASTVLFVVAKRRQWNVRASIVRASRRLTGRAPVKDPERDAARSRRTGTYFAPPKSGVTAVMPPGHKRGLVVDVNALRSEKSMESLTSKTAKYNPTKEQTTKKSILGNGRK